MHAHLLAPRKIGGVESLNQVVVASWFKVVLIQCNSLAKKYYLNTVWPEIFGGKIFWRIAENMSFGGIYFGG